MTRLAVVGARGHRALAQVWRRVSELDELTAVLCDEASPVGAVAAIAARQRGLHVDALGGASLAGRADAVEAFPWDDGDAENVVERAHIGHTFKRHLPITKVADDLAAGVRPSGAIESWCM